MTDDRATVEALRAEVARLRAENAGLLEAAARREEAHAAALAEGEARLLFAPPALA